MNGVPPAIDEATDPLSTPVRWDPDPGVFRVSGFAEAAQVLRGDGWSSDPRRNPFASPLVRELPPGSMLFADPPDHTRLRRHVAPAFTPRAIERLRPRVTAIIESAVEGLAGVGPDVDILYDLAYPVTLAVIAELFDVGVEGAGLFADLTPVLTRGLETHLTDEDVHASAAASAELTLFLAPILVDRAQHPGDDMISALVASGDHEDALAINETVASCILLLAAGHETTAHLIANSTLALLTHPDQIPHLLASPTRGVEELLRTHGAVKTLARTALADHDLGGRHVPAGSCVLVDLHRANRDPHRFALPDVLDLSRVPRTHLAFGGGPHFCLGAGLARLELTETLPRLLLRHPELGLAGPEPRCRDSTTFHALVELPINL